MVLCFFRISPAGHRSQLLSDAPDRISDSDDEFEWDTDGDHEVAGSIDGAGTSAAGSRNLDAPGPSTLAGPSSSLVEHFVGMGFEEKMVLKAIKENGFLARIIREGHKVRVLSEDGIS